MKFILSLLILFLLSSCEETHNQRLVPRKCVDVETRLTAIVMIDSALTTQDTFMLYRSDFYGEGTTLPNEEIKVIIKP